MPHASLDAFCYDKIPVQHLQDYVETLVKEKGFKKPRYDVRPGSKAGDNYASILYRVEVTDEEDTSRKWSIMVKSALQNAAIRGAMRLYRAFKNEANFYNIILVAYARLLREKGLLGEHESYPDAARCYMASIGGGAEQDKDALILQDMKPEGFVLQNRRQGQDVHHCRLVLRALAHLHALSFAMELLRPEDFQRLRTCTEELFDRGSDIMKLFEKEVLTKNTLEMIEKRFPEGTREYEKVKEYCGIIQEDIQELIAPCPDGGNVITHGDCWISNLLFKYSESGAVQRVCLLDFQVTRYASPALDLSYFLFTSTEKAMRDAHLDALLEEYHAELHARMRLLGVRDPDALFSWQRFQDHLKRYGRFGLITGILAVPVFIAEQDEVPDLSEAFENGGDFSTAFVVKKKGDTASRDQRISDLIQDIIERGYL